MSSPSIQKHESYTGGYDPLILGALARREAVREAAFFVPFLKPEMRILDCGCGPGGISLGLASLADRGSVVGIDVEDGQLERGRQEARIRGLSNVEFQHASVYALPFADSSFDAVLAHAMVYHLGEPMKALHEIRRVLKTGGLVGLRALTWTGCGRLRKRSFRTTAATCGSGESTARCCARPASLKLLRRPRPTRLALPSRQPDSAVIGLKFLWRSIGR